MAGFNAVVQDSAGNALTNIVVEVRDAASLALVPVFSNAAMSIALGNPFNWADGSHLIFYVASGIYKITVTKGGFTQIWNDQQIGDLGGGGGGAPTDAEYVVAALHGSLVAERLLVNTASVTWDFSTPGQAKANAVVAAGSAPDGTVAAPGMSFAAQTTTGFFRPASGQIGVSVNNLEAARWINDAGVGRLIVGHTASVVAGTGVTGMIQIHALSNPAFTLTRWDNGAGANFLTFAKSRGGAMGAHGTVQAADVLFNIQGSGSDGASFLAGVRIRALADGAFSPAGSAPGRFDVGTTPAGSSAPITRLSIFNDGGIVFGAGTTSPGAGVFQFEGGVRATNAIITTDDATNTGVTYPLALVHTTSGVPGIGIGVGMTFSAETSAGNNENLGIIQATALVVTPAGEQSKMTHWGMFNGIPQVMFDVFPAAGPPAPSTFFDFPGFAMFRAIGPGPCDIQFQASDDIILNPNSGANADSPAASPGKFEVSGGANNLITSLNGTLISNTNVFPSGLPTNPLVVQHYSGVTSAIVYPLRVEAASVGVAGAGFGAGIEFNVQIGAVPNYKVGGTIEVVTKDATGASEDFDLVFKLMRAGGAASEFMRIGMGVSNIAMGIALGGNAGSVNDNGLFFSPSPSTGWQIGCAASPSNTQGTGGGFSSGNAGAGNNLPGGGFNFLCGRGTGTGNPPDIGFYSYAPVAAGPGLQTLTECMRANYLGAWILPGIAASAGGVVSTGLRISSGTNFGIFFGSGAPTLAAAVGSIYLRTDGAINARVYVSTNAAGGAGSWTAWNTLA